MLHSQWQPVHRGCVTALCCAGALLCCTGTASCGTGAALCCTGATAHMVQMQHMHAAFSWLAGPFKAHAAVRGWRQEALQLFVWGPLSNIAVKCHLMGESMTCVLQQSTSHRITSHKITSHHIASHRVASHHTASHRITSHHITAH